MYLHSYMYNSAMCFNIIIQPYIFQLDKRPHYQICILSENNDLAARVGKLRQCAMKTKMCFRRSKAGTSYRNINWRDVQRKTVVNNVYMSSLSHHDKMACTETSIQNNTKTGRTRIRNIHKRTIVCVFRLWKIHNIVTPICLIAYYSI